jgi:hypothetical protein
MKVYFYLLIPLLFLLGCNKSSNPVETTPEVSAVIKIALSPYGESMDSLYYKYWSDGTWEKYNGLITANGKKFYTTISNTGSIYYYDETGYAGWKDKTSTSPIFYNYRSGYLPDTVSVGESYTIIKTFVYSGYTYTVKSVFTVNKPVDLQFTYIKFFNCIEIAGVSTVTAGSESQTSNSTSWEAAGPGTVKQMVNNSYYIAVTDAYVNGKTWKISAPGSVSKTSEISFNKNSLLKDAMRTKPFLRMNNHHWGSSETPNI